MKDSRYVKIYQGRNVGQVSRNLGITEQTYYHWRKEYGGMKKPR
jgi:putative transposase